MANADGPTQGCIFETTLRVGGLDYAHSAHLFGIAHGTCGFGYKWFCEWVFAILVFIVSAHYREFFESSKFILWKTPRDHWDLKSSAGFICEISKAVLTLIQVPTLQIDRPLSKQRLMRSRLLSILMVGEG